MTVSKIVIHHTVDSDSEAIEHYFEKKSEGKSKSSMWSHMYYDIVVEKDGTFKQHRTLTERSRATRVNNDSVNIALVWNFNEEKPTNEQIKTLKELISDIRLVFPELPVYEHWELEGEATACAGKNFHTGMLGNSVTIDWHPHRASDIASYAYDKCITHTGNLMYSCEEMIKTFNGENGRWLYNVVSPANENWTRDHWICQLNDKYHSPFISSREFQDPYKQVDYCWEVWLDANKKKKMPWRAYYKMEERGKNVIFN